MTCSLVDVDIGISAGKASCCHEVLPILAEITVDDVVHAVVEFLVEVVCCLFEDPNSLVISSDCVVLGIS